MIPQHLLDLLVCPATKQSLVYNKATNELISDAAGLAYPVRNGIPILLIDEARIIDDEKAKIFKAVS